MGTATNKLEFLRAVGHSFDHQYNVNRVANDHYRVDSDSGNTYNVYVQRKSDQTLYDCDCKAGEFGGVCWHAAMIADLPNEVANRNFSGESIPTIGLKQRAPEGYEVKLVPVS